jgi:beta-alanine--pyruvate transaminase
MPFTANRQFKKAPRLLARAEACTTGRDSGRQVLDAVAGLWCVNAGHNRPRIVQAIQQQAAEMDFAPPFQMGHPKAFELADRVAQAGAGRAEQGVLHQLRAPRRWTPR